MTNKLETKFAQDVIVGDIIVPYPGYEYMVNGIETDDDGVVTIRAELLNTNKRSTSRRIFKFKELDIIGIE